MQGMARHCNFLPYYLRSDQSFFHSDQGTYWPQTKCSANSPNKRSAICKGSKHAQWTPEYYVFCQVGFVGLICLLYLLISFQRNRNPNSISTPLRMVSFSFMFRAKHESLKFLHCHAGHEATKLIAWTLTQSTKLQGKQTNFELARMHTHHLKSLMLFTNYRIFKHVPLFFGKPRKDVKIFICFPIKNLQQNLGFRNPFPWESARFQPVKASPWPLDRSIPSNASCRIETCAEKTYEGSSWPTPEKPTWKPKKMMCFCSFRGFFFQLFLRNLCCVHVIFFKGVNKLSFNTHRIHVWYIYTYIWLWDMVDFAARLWYNEHGNLFSWKTPPHRQSWCACQLKNQHKIHDDTWNRKTQMVYVNVNVYIYIYLEMI